MHTYLRNLMAKSCKSKCKILICNSWPSDFLNMSNNTEQCTHMYVCLSHACMLFCRFDCLSVCLSVRPGQSGSYCQDSAALTEDAGCAGSHQPLLLSPRDTIKSPLGKGASGGSPAQCSWVRPSLHSWCVSLTTVGTSVKHLVMFLY